MTPDVRCSSCGKPRRVNSNTRRKWHCDSPTCTWCLACVVAKRKEYGVPT